MKGKIWNITVTLLCVLLSAAAVICAPFIGNRAAAYVIVAAVLVFCYTVLAPAIGK